MASRAALPLLLLLFACSGGEDPSGDPVDPTGDAGPGSDTGPSPDPDAGPSPDPDAGTSPDGGTGCDPITGDGCTGGDLCFAVPRLGPQCREPIQPGVAVGEACSPDLQNCVVGASCLAIQGDPGPSCHQVCRPGAADCGGGGGQVRSCVPINDFGGYGVCRAAGTSCDPLSPICAAMQTCSFVPGGLDTACTDSGPVQRGGACTTASNNCAPGEGICVGIGGDPARCLAVCGTGRPCPGGERERCTMLSSGGRTTPFGVCIERQESDCDPLMPMCPAGQVCSLGAGLATNCTAAGTAARGESCQSSNCAAGQGICVNLGMEPTCYQLCDPMALDTGCPPATQCRTLSSGGESTVWGICN